MAKKYVISTTNQIEEISAALTAYYGTGVTIYGSDATYVVFSIPAISDRVIKIGINGYVYTGTSWTSGVTIANQIQTTGSYNSGANYTFYLVLTPTSIYYTYSSAYPVEVLITRLSNGRAVCMGSTSSSNGSVSAAHYGKYLDEDTRIYFATLNSTVSYRFADSKIITFPILFQHSDYSLLLNTDGTPAYAIDVVQCPKMSDVLDATNIFVRGVDKYYFNCANFGYMSNGYFFTLD